MKKAEKEFEENLVNEYNKPKLSVNWKKVTNSWKVGLRLKKRIDPGYKDI